MDKLLAKLSEQQAIITRQHEALRSSDESSTYARTAEYVATTASSSILITPATETYNNSTAPTTGPPSDTEDDKAAVEVARLKAELEAANAKMARMDQELSQTRNIKHTIDQAIGNVSEADFPLQHQVADRVNTAPPSIRQAYTRDNSWAVNEDAHSDTSDALSAGGFNRARAIWTHGKPTFGGFNGALPAFQPTEGLGSNQFINRGFGPSFDVNAMAYAAPPMNGYRADRSMPDPDLLMAPPAARRNNPVGGRFNNRSSNNSFPYASSNSSFDSYTPTSTAFGSVANMTPGMPSLGGPIGMVGLGMLNTGMNIYGGYQPQPIGSPLSPHAPEFTSSNTSWKTEVREKILSCPSSIGSQVSR